MSAQFIFAVCQKGAETVCKNEILSHHHGVRFAFSRPGFLTFKVEPDALPEKFHLKSTFARTYGWSLGNTKSTDLGVQVDSILEQPIVDSVEHIHVWQRDSKIPGTGGFEPGETQLSKTVATIVAEKLKDQTGRDLFHNRIAKANQKILDIVMVEPDQWWWGYHYATAKFQRWPGGTPKIETQPSIVSRAYYKLREALLWSGVHIQPGDICAEIGSSPGGACQLLLEKGAHVIAIDPSEMEAEIAAHPNLVHLRCRGREVKKKDFRDTRWLLSDINATPTYTLDTVEDIVRHASVRNIRGLILTLKLADWSLADQIGEWRKRTQDLGFAVVKTRQLAFNRQEICLFAIRDQFALRSTKKH